MEKLSRLRNIGLVAVSGLALLVGPALHCYSEKNPKPNKDYISYVYKEVDKNYSPEKAEIIKEVYREIQSDPENFQKLLDYYEKNEKRILKSFKDYPDYSYSWINLENPKKICKENKAFLARHDQALERIIGEMIKMHVHHPKR